MRPFEICKRGSLQVFKKALLASAVALLAQSAFALGSPAIGTLGVGNTAAGGLVMNDFDSIPGITGGDIAYDVNRFHLGNLLSGTYELTFTSSVDGWSSPIYVPMMAFGAAPHRVDELYQNLGLQDDGSLFAHQEMALGQGGKTTFVAKSGTDYYAYVYGIVWPGQGAGIGNYTLQLSLVSAVPEPAGYALMLGGLGLLGFVGRRTKRG